VKVIAGKAAGGGVNGDQSDDDPYSNKTLRLMMSSFLEKAAVYRMPHPDLHIEGVPDEEEQASPREHIKAKVREMMADGGKKTQ
jgi:hypothetical protein